MVEPWIPSGWFHSTQFRSHRLTKVTVMTITTHYMYSTRKDTKYKVGIMFLFLMLAENFVSNACGMFE